MPQPPRPSPCCFAATSLNVTRSSKDTYTPAWWVPGAHLQTLWGKLIRRPPDVPTRAEWWTTPDDDEIELQRLDAPHGAGGHTPRLLILHGLEGTIRSHYLRGLLNLARQQGWAADVLIFRGCSSKMNRAPRLYHSGETSDLDYVVRRLIAENPSQPLVAAGFSLGGNVLLKWLGEQGEFTPEQFRAAAAVSVPYDLERGSRHLERPFSRIYARHFLRTLRRKALAKLAQHPGLFDELALRRAATLFVFDDAVTAPMHGFAGARDYYSRASSKQFLSHIRRPTLLLSSLDDPFLPREVLDSVAIMAVDNQCLSVEFHEHGGHVGFVGGRYPWCPEYYAEKRILHFLGKQLAISSFSPETSLAKL
jgi:predicted alpha/beta-fold hydrolase